jgi:uncharacterized membrane protein
MQDKELKHEFELERVILFSDAVFAIIITIMVLDIKLPEDLRHAKAGLVQDAFLKLIPKLVGYIVSFFLVSMFWVRHLKIFKTLRDYDVALVARNLVFLFIISLFPFAVSIISGTLSPRNYWSFDVYVTIILAGTFTQTVIVQYIVKHKQRLCFAPEAVEDTLRWKVHKLNFIVIPIALAALVVINFLGQVQWAPYVIVVQAIVLKRQQNKYYPKKPLLNKHPVKEENEAVSLQD